MIYLIDISIVLIVLVLFYSNILMVFILHQCVSIFVLFFDVKHLLYVMTLL